MPDVSHIKVLGCKAFVLIKLEKYKKFEKIEPRVEIDIFIKYKAYNI